MDMPSQTSLDALTDLGLRDRIDMRPTLLRVLTDLYVQKPTHTPQEERHYTELALRLLDGVDVPTRAVVAARLTRYRFPPARVMERLAGELQDPITHVPPPQRTVAATVDAVRQGTDATPARAGAPRSNVAHPVDANAAQELNELFFTADAAERRLILLNLDIVGTRASGRGRALRDPAAGKRLEAAALARSRDGFARELAASLQISRELAQRIARDDLGETIVVATKALGVPRELVYRILLFINTAIGHSVERVHALADLYDELPVPAADEIVAIWQALQRREPATAKHQPLLWNDETSRARPAAASTRKPLAAPRRNERRDAS